MAMIKCPNCNEKISDKSPKCVKCGYCFTDENKIKCEECGTLINCNAELCPNCGCPVKVTVQKKENELKVKKRRKKAVKITVILILIVAIITAVIFSAIQIFNIRKEEASDAYRFSLKTTLNTILDGGIDSEKCGNLVINVWHNSIWKESDVETDKYTMKDGVFYDDFNDALQALYADSDFMVLVDSVEQNQDEVGRYMRDLKNPPEDFAEAYDEIKELYDEYLTLSNMCIDPNGSLQTYSEKFNDADTRVSNSYEKVKSYLNY